MRRFVFFVLMCWSAMGWGQQTDKFTVQFGGLGDDEGQKIIQTFDTGYAIIGSTGSFGNGSSDMYLLKLDKAGFLQWSKTFGGANVENGYGIVQLKDSGYIVVGNTNSKGYGGYDGYIVRTNKVGDTIWTRTFGGADWDFLYDVKALSDTTFIAVGKTSSFGSGDYDCYLIKFDVNGDTLKTKAIGGSQYEDSKSITKTFEGNYLIGGSTSSFGNGMKDFYINLVNANLNIIWSKTFGGISDDVCNKVLEDIDTAGFFVFGSTASYGVALNDFWLIRLNNNGDTIWTKTRGNYDDEEGFGMCETNWQHILTCGLTAGAGYHKALLYQSTYTNVDVFQTQFSGFSTDDAITYASDAYDIIHTSDSGYIFVGKSRLIDANESNIYVVKMNWHLETATLINDIQIQSPSKIYPNPFDDFIKISSNKNNPNTISLYDMLGNCIITQNYSNSLITINTTNLNRGVYIIKIFDTQNKSFISISKAIKY